MAADNDDYDPDTNLQDLLNSLGPEERADSMRVAALAAEMIDDTLALQRQASEAPNAELWLVENQEKIAYVLESRSQLTRLLTSLRVKRGVPARTIDAVDAYVRETWRALDREATSTNGAGPQHPPTAPKTPGGAHNPDEREFFLAHEYNDLGNAECLLYRHGHEYRHTTAYGWLRWNGQCWNGDDAEKQLTQDCFQLLRDRRATLASTLAEKMPTTVNPTAFNVRNALFAFESFPAVAANASDLDADPFLLNCANGSVDLREGTVTPHHPEQRFTYCLSTAYDAKADETVWRSFLWSVLGDQAAIGYLQEAVGYSLTGLTSEECFFYVYGQTRSGKGTFAETLLALLGRPLSAQVDFGTFTARRDADSQNFDLAPLKPTRFIVASESGRAEVLNEAKMKSLTGGDHVRCAFKHRDMFDYRPQFKVWMFSNHALRGDVDDDAFWIRARVIEFPNSFAGHEDKGMKARLRRKAALEGVLAWSVAGAIRYFRRERGLETPERVTQATATQRGEFDTVGRFLDDCCVTDPTAWTANAVFYAAYQTWCHENGHQPKSIITLGQSLRRKGLEPGNARKLDGRTVKGVFGVGLI